MRSFYMGDVNPEHGGYFYTLEGFKHDYVDAVRIVPCSDAGGPNNLFWVERITVCLRTKDPEKLDRILETVGSSRAELQTMRPAQRRHFLIDAHISYGEYDQESTLLIQLGKDPDPFFNYGYVWNTDATPNKILRANASIGRFARSQLN